MKFKIRTKIVLILVTFWSIILIFALSKAESSPNIKEGHILISNPTQNGSFFISLASSQNEVVSPVLRADFPFNALFIKWRSEKAKLNATDIYVRFLNENWSNWIKIELDDDFDGKDGAKSEISSQMVPTKLTDTFQYKISFADDNEKKNIKNLDFTYLDTTRGPNSNLKTSLSQNASQIISRKNWGADESYRYDQQGNELWPEDYYMPKRFIIHHTAGEDANLNSMAAIRAIYYWHAKVKNWGDIGYNYIIDSKGNIYEGRAGGDGVVGGHAYLNNRGSIGIAILGCYENKNDKKNSTCNTPDQITEATKLALNKLIAEKSREFSIDPLGQSEFAGKMLPTIIGHRDVAATNCPGSLLYELLPQTRQLAYNILQDLGGYKKPLPTSAEFVKQSAKEINVEETRTAEVIVEFKNTGQETWRGYEDNYLFIADSGIKNKMAKIDNFKIALESEKEESSNTESSYFYKLLGGNVYPGQIGRFKLALDPPLAATKETKNFILAWSERGYFPNTEFSIVVNKVLCTSCNQLITDSDQQLRAKLAESNLEQKWASRETKEVKLAFLNNGKTAWLAKNLKLKLVNPDKKEKIYQPSQTIFIEPLDKANFNFNLTAFDTAGIYSYEIILLHGEKELYRGEQQIKVVAPYSAELLYSDIPDSMVRNSRKTVALTFKNTGTKIWELPTLRSYDIDNTNSWFKDWSWLNSKTIKQVKKTVKPGEEITFKFKILAYWKANTYPNVFKLYDGKTQISIGKMKNLQVSIKVTKK